MKRWWWIAAGLAVVTAMGVASLAWWLWRDTPEEWTSVSREALGELEDGLRALSKFYFGDAQRHFERALDLDPGFEAARLHLALMHLEGDPERRRLMDRLAAADLERLNEQERWLIRYHLARDAGDLEGARRVVEGYLERNPDSAYALFTRCGEDWAAQDWEAADACYRRLIEQHPNWVLAQNRLGYIAMARGRFSEAEEHFRTYRFIAPDQAAPNGSLGQLLTILGRYDEAEETLDRAVAIKSDYCEAHRSRIFLGLLSARPDHARRAAEQLRALPACDWLQRWGLCGVEAWVEYFDGNLAAAEALIAGECRQRREGRDLLGHRLAVAAGDWQRARALEEELRRSLEERSESDPEAVTLEAMLLHMKGVGALAEGDWSRAAGLFQEVDALNNYWGLQRAHFKLFNRLHLIHALRRAGDTASAEALTQKVSAINPHYLADVHLPDLEALGGDRRR